MDRYTGKEEYHDIYPEYNSTREHMIRHKDRAGASAALLSGLMTTLAAAALVLGVSAGSMNMGRTTVDIWESLVPYEGLGFADITMIGHFSYEDTERLRLMKAVSMERPVCAMEDESAIFIKNGKVEIIGIIHRIEKGEIRLFTEEDVQL